MAFLAINMGKEDPIAQVRTFIENNNYSFPVAYDESSKNSERFEINHLPTLLIIDKSGHVRVRHIGYSSEMEDYASMICQYVEELIGEESSST